MKNMIFVLLLSLSFGVQASEPNNPQIRLDYHFADVNQVVQDIGRLTGFNVVAPDNLDFRITLYNSKALTPSQAIKAFEYALNAHNYTIIKKRGYFLITKLDDAFYRSDVSSGEFETVVIPTFQPHELKGLFQPLLSPFGKLSASVQFDLLVITDLSNNVKRLRYLSNQFKQSYDSVYSSFSYRFDYLNLSKNEPSLKSFLDGFTTNSTTEEKGGMSNKTKQNSSSINYFFNHESNTILLLGSKRKLERIKHYFHSIDKPAYTVSKQYRLDNIKPSEVPVFKGLSYTVFDNTGFLRVDGQQLDVDLFDDFIKKLDRPKRAITFKLIISAVSSRITNNFDFDFGLSLGSLGLSLGGVSIDTASSGDAFSAFLTYLESNSQSTILSKPFIQILEGESASMNVGKEIPFKTSTVDQSTGQVVQNYERQNVGLNLVMTPTIRPDGKIKLSVSQGFSSVSNYQLDDVDEVVTDNQQIETVLLMRPNYLYSVAGLDDRRLNDTESGLPIFGHIIGSDASQSETYSLMIFLVASIETERAHDSIGWEWR